MHKVINKYSLMCVNIPIGFGGGLGGYGGGYSSYGGGYGGGYGYGYRPYAGGMYGNVDSPFLQQAEVSEQSCEGLSVTTLLF